MKKIRMFLVGAALALPLAAFGGAGNVIDVSTSAAKPPTMTSVENGICCVIYMGTWLCWPC